MKAKALPKIMIIASKLDAKPIVEKLKTLDFKSLDDGKQLSNEDAAILLTEITADILPQLGKIADDVIPLIALMKDISEEEAGNLDLFDALKEVFGNKDFLSFFKSALMKNQG